MAEEPEQPNRDHAGHWRRGCSGNPRGKRKGTRHRATVLAERLLEEDATDVVQAVITKARGGDIAAAKLVLDRILPPRKGCTVTFDLPDLKAAADLPQAVASVTRSIAEGTLTPDEGAAVVTVLEAQRRAIETAELEARIRILEEKSQHEPPR
jgi:hypothetical protein